MKIVFLVLFLLVVPSVFAQEITGFVNDGASILKGEKAQIEGVLKQLYDMNVAQIAVVTVSSLEGQPIETVAFDLAEGTLGMKDKDNGLLLLIALEEQSYRFEVGRGLEPVFNDAKVGRYGREILVPAFQKEEYGIGVLMVLNEMSKELTGEEITGIVLPVQQGVPLDMKIQALFSFLFFVLFVLAFVGRRNAHMRDNKYFLGALIASQMLRGGGGSMGGGFGGFGGGSFGGGGAGSSW